jgi:hypothetical protein
MTTVQATGFEIVKEAMTTLEFYRTYYASSEQYVQRLNEVISLLRNRAERFKDGELHGEYKFIMMFAGTLEITSRPGAYLPITGASA